jgi:endonuclease-3
MTRKARTRKVLDLLAKHIPVPETELEHGDPFELLVAVILSAQCTDKRVNLTTPALFERFPDSYSLAEATFDEVFPLIRSISYPNNKAKHLIGMAQQLVSEHGGKVPQEYDALLKLPGVGRKTANVIASIVWNEPRLAVDTHVFRVANRIGLSDGKTPLAVEKELTANIPDERIPQAHHYLILHGRYTCVARNPKCEKCPLPSICLYFSAQKTGS